MIRIEHASPRDLVAICELLKAAGLPTSDLEGARPEFIVLREEDRILAAGALERFGSAALVRSIVVDRRERGRGFGRRVVQELERMALHHEIEQLVLLTQTAVEFFHHEGYRTIERAAAPAALQESAEFRSLCPSSATCMVKVLAGN